MERNPLDLLDELGHSLTHFVTSEGPFVSNEKLIEAIHLELRYLILPEMAKGCNPTFDWTNGDLNIFISIHVEGEDQFNYSIEITEIP